MSYLLLDNPQDVSEQRTRLENFETVHLIKGDTKEQHWPISVLPGINRFNVLAGPNNSGKSRLMRQIFSHDFIVVEDTDGTRLGSLITFMRECQKAFKEGISWTDDRLKVEAHALTSQLEHFFREPSVGASKLPPTGSGIFINDKRLELHLSSEVLNNLRSHPSSTASQVFRHLFDSFVTPTEKANLELELKIATPTRVAADHLPISWRGTKTVKIYCPPIRSNLRIADVVKFRDRLSPEEEAPNPACSIDPLAAAYCHSFGWDPSAYSWRMPGAKSVITGGRFYEQVEASSQDIGRERYLWQDGVSTILGQLLGLRKVELVNSRFRNHVDQKDLSPIRHVRVMTEAGNYSIHELGDGVFACLVLLLPLFMTETEGLFFIEEPETHLHPGLQREFVKILFHQKLQMRPHGLYITTHSPIILDALAERAGRHLSIIRVDKTEGTEQEPNRHQVRRVDKVTVDILEELGATANALLARSLVLVEGPSDVRYVRALIELYLREHKGVSLIEGRDYAIIAYGGSLLGDLLTRGDDKLASEVLPATAHYALILADEDRDKEEHHERIRQLLAPLGGRFAYETTADSLEIENLLPFKVWSHLFPEVGPRKWAKPLEGRIVSEEVLRRARLGSVAGYVFEGKELSLSGGDKLEAHEKLKAATVFAELVFQNKLQWKELSDSARNYTVKVCDFLKKVIARSGGFLEASPSIS